MKINLYGILMLLTFVFHFSCTQATENSDSINIEETLDEQTPQTSERDEDASHDMNVGAPIVMRNRDKVEIYNIAVDENSRVDKSVTSKSYKEGTGIEVFARGKLQFEVPLRMDYPIQDWKYEGVDTIAAISDIEGHYNALVAWLKSNEIITEDFKWSFGNNHLVFNGDMVDRGDEVFQSLWLIYKLEAEAEAAGGKVHYVFGNHEQLNVQGIYDRANLQYVNPRYFNEADVLGLDYSNWLSKETELGRWIRTKNAIVQIDEKLFVHGGISPRLVYSHLTKKEVNDINRSTLLIPSKEYNMHQTLIASEDGPLWYRGLADEDITQAQVQEILDQYKCKQIIIGHTMVSNDNIEPLYNGSVIPIDLAVRQNFRKGIVKGIMITASGVFEVDNKRVYKMIDRAEL